MRFLALVAGLLADSCCARATPSASCPCSRRRSRSRRPGTNSSGDPAAILSLYVGAQESGTRGGRDLFVAAGPDYLVGWATTARGTTWQLRGGPGGDDCGDFDGPAPCTLVRTGEPAWKRIAADRVR